MRMPTKFVEEITEEHKSRLQKIMRSQAPPRERMRAHAILLSVRRFSIDQIAAIYEIDRDRVSRWLERWRETGFDGLRDEPRAGRPPKLSETEQVQLLRMIKEEPRSVRQAVSLAAKRLKKK